MRPQAFEAAFCFMRPQAFEAAFCFMQPQAPDLQHKCLLSLVQCDSRPGSSSFAVCRNAAFDQHPCKGWQPSVAAGSTTWLSCTANGIISADCELASAECQFGWALASGACVPCLGGLWLMVRVCLACPASSTTWLPCIIQSADCKIVSRGHHRTMTPSDERTTCQTQNRLQCSLLCSCEQMEKLLSLLNLAADRVGVNGPAARQG
jgi:hypothetical protein